MMKSLLAGIAICTALAVFAGNANAYKAHTHKTYRTMTRWDHRQPLGWQPHWMPPVYTGPYGGGPRGGDPIYDACENPWRHLDVQCGGNDAGG